MRLIPQLSPARWPSWLTGAALLGLAGFAPGARATTFGEPATVFYGRIIGTGSERPFVVTQGELRWTLRRADGRDLTLRTTLFPLRDGEFSYRLNVPHEALALGLAASATTVPLTAASQVQQHLRITVNGLDAVIRGPAGAQFETAQVRRAATYRLDLEVPLVPEDSDGDGLPDWWEQMHGADLDPNADLDGDGRSNRAEFLAGTDPRRDDRRPELLTRELRAYAEATTGVHLRVADTDTSPDRLTFTLTRPPDGARLALRNARENPDAPDVPLAGGARFSQQDVLQGRLVLEHTGGDTTGTSFEVSVRDDTAQEAADTATVRVTFYRAPASLRASGTQAEWIEIAQRAGSLPGVEPFEEQTARNHLLAKGLNAVVWDGADELLEQELAAPSAFVSAEEYQTNVVPKYGPDRPQLLVGGRAADRLVGGMEDDVLVGGEGADRLRGNGGSDRFVLLRSAGGQTVVEDFHPEEGDILDLGRALAGASTRLEDYLRIATSGGGVVLELGYEGPGANYGDHRVRLAGVAPAAADLHRWVAEGHLVAPGLQLRSRIELVAGLPDAGEEGPTSGGFHLTRLGSLEEALTVRLAISGSALNGLDYARIPDHVTFTAGQRELEIAVAPYPDNQAEPAEFVELSLLKDDAYDLTESAQVARVLIADLPVVIGIEAIEPVATLNPASPGVFLLRRSTVLDRSVLVRLETAGSAVAGADYVSLPRFVNLAPGQTTALLEVTPRPGATLDGRAPTVQLTVLPDAAYRVDTASRAQVTLLPQPVSFAGWRADEFPGVTGGLEAFAQEDRGQVGLTMLQRYAFGMDATHPDLRQRPRVVVRDGHLTLEYWRRAGATDVEYRVEVSRDLREWTSSPNAVQEIPAAVDDSATSLSQRVSVRALPGVDSAAVGFMRLRIAYRP